MKINKSFNEVKMLLAKTRLTKTQGLVILIILILILISIIFVALPQRLTVYSCPSSIDAEACIRCKRQSITDGVKSTGMDFLVNKSAASVMRRDFFKVNGKEIVQPILYEKCKIFDEKNWDCGEIDISLGSYTKKYVAMTNGIFSSYSEENFKYMNDTGICAR